MRELCRRWVQADIEAAAAYMIAFGRNNPWLPFVFLCFVRWRDPWIRPKVRWSQGGKLVIIKIEQVFLFGYGDSQVLLELATLAVSLNNSHTGPHGTEIKPASKGACKPWRGFIIRGCLDRHFYYASSFEGMSYCRHVNVFLPPWIMTVIFSNNAVCFKFFNYCPQIFGM